MQLRYFQYLVIISFFCVYHQAYARIKNLKISVIIPCDYKHVMYLEELLKAYEKQTVLPHEIVIAVSRVNDTTQRIINHLKKIDWHFSVKYIMTKATAYAGENRNKASQIASGDILIYQDADDLPTPQRIQIIKYLFNAYNIDHLIHSYYFTQEYKRNKIFKSTELKNIECIFPSSYAEVKKINKIHNGHIAIRRTVFEKIPWPTKAKGQDVLFNEQVYMSGMFRCMITTEPLTIYRIENSSWIV